MNIAYSWQRVSALVLRHLYLLRNSWLRCFELLYWPTLNIMVWGFLSQFFTTHSSWLSQSIGLLLGAVLLWEVVIRSQFGVYMSFFEEMWSRNFANLFVTPLHPGEYVASMVIMSILRTFLSVTPAVLVTIWLYHYNIFTMGPPLLLFFVNLLMIGWWMGLLIGGLLVNFGSAAESVAWMSMFILSPIAGIYYPISTLPEWIQPLAWAFPTAYVFEGMRELLQQGHLNISYMGKAFGLNISYLIISMAVFLAAFARARRTGKLIQMGE
ncbi:MAG: ABC transporter permease [Dongiaceae bacterium]